jgi:hypothetical protein
VVVVVLEQTAVTVVTLVQMVMVSLLAGQDKTHLLLQQLVLALQELEILLLLLLLLREQMVMEWLVAQVEMEIQLRFGPEVLVVHHLAVQGDPVEDH